MRKNKEQAWNSDCELSDNWIKIVFKQAKNPERQNKKKQWDQKLVPFNTLVIKKTTFAQVDSAIIKRTEK